MTEKQPYENLPKVWAWDYDKEKGQIAYHCLNRESDYYRHLAIQLDGVPSWFVNIEPYKEPSKRPMNFWEALKLKAENPQVAFKEKEEVVLNPFLDIWFAMDFKDFEYTLDYGKTWQDCEVEE